MLSRLKNGNKGGKLQPDNGIHDISTRNIKKPFHG
jgi:hypothetical protein